MTVQVGDIFSCSWGYSMTIVDFYQVQKTTAKGVYLREIAKEEMHDGNFGGKCIPKKDQYISEDVIFRRLKKGKVLKLSTYKFAYLWDGKPKSFNHLD
jgi:hypothetical protein